MQRTYPFPLALLLVFEVQAFTDVCDKKSRGSKIFSTRTAYDEVRHKEVKVEEIPGCDVRTFYTLNRHGTRYPGSDEILDMHEHLPSLRDRIVASSKQGCLCGNQVAALRQWRPSFSPELHLQNTDVGLQEMHDLGSRWRYRFPTIFSTARPSVDMRCGNFSRLHESAQLLYSGMVSDQSPKKNIKCTSVSSEEDHLLMYLDNCAKYISSRIKPSDPEKVQTALYDGSPLVAKMLDNLHRRLGLTPGTINFTTAALMYEACRFEHAVYRYAPWCEVFSSSDLETLVYRQDMKYYWRYGHGRTINSQPSCVLLADLVSALQNSVTGQESPRRKKVYIRMGSSRSILPLLVKMGLFQDNDHLRTNTSRINNHRKWQLGLINPFASNLVLVHYSCQSGHKIRMFLNERSIRPPGCDSYWCPAEEFLNRWAQTADECDFTEICDDDTLDLSDYQFDMHHL